MPTPKSPPAPAICCGKSPFAGCKPTIRPAVRRLLRDYGEQAEDARLRRVEQLAKLAGGEGVAAPVPHRAVRPLAARVAHGGPGDHSARRARRARRRRVDPDVVEQRTGRQHAGRRRRGCANIWRNCAIRPPRSPLGSNSIDEESARLEQNGETSNEIVLGLLWNLAELYRQLGDQPAVIDVARSHDRHWPTTRRTTRSSTC